MRLLVRLDGYIGLTYTRGMDTISPAAPDAAVTEHEVLRELHELGERLALRRYVKTAEAKEQRDLIYDQVRLVVDRGIDLGFTRTELAEAVGISLPQLINIRRGDPTGQTTWPTKGTSLTPELRERLQGLGDELRQWRNARVYGAKEKRAALREQVREIVNKDPQALAATTRDIAYGLGISFQALNNIMRDNPSGRSATSAAYVQIDPQLRALLQKFGSAWTSVTGSRMAEVRDNLYDSFVDAVEEAREAGLTLNEICDVSGLSYAQLNLMLHGSRSERNR
jgi:hypothetical protein